MEGNFIIPPGVPPKLFLLPSLTFPSGLLHWLAINTELMAIICPERRNAVSARGVWLGMGPLTRGQPPKWLRLTDPSVEEFGAQVWRVPNAVATWESRLPPWP